MNRLYLFTILCLQFWSKNPAVAQSSNPSETRVIMDQIFTSLTTVLPLSMKSSEFSDVKNRPIVLSELRKMRDSTSTLVEHTKKFEGSYGYIAKSLSQDIKDIYNWYDKNSFSEARYLLGQVTENCVSCHMKLPDSGHAPKMDLFFKNVNISTLSDPEKTRLQVALRQFDDALLTWESMFKTWNKPNELFAMDTLPEYLKVVIRVKSDTNRAELALKTLLNRTDLPKFMTREVNAWKDALSNHSEDLKKTGNELNRAEKIIQQARSKMDYPMDRSGLVEYIVASSLLNRFLQNKTLKPDDKANAYYLLGITETLIGRNTWLTQAEYYLQEAIRSAPHSKYAVKAFDAYEQQIIMEYSGSSGTNIPEDVLKIMEELRQMIKK